MTAGSGTVAYKHRTHFILVAYLGVAGNVVIGAGTCFFASRQQQDDGKGE